MNGRGKVIDRIGNFVKHYRQPGTEILRYKDLKVWSYYDWSKCYAGLFIIMVKGEISFPDKAIVFIREIRPLEELEGGTVFMLIRSIMRAVKQRKLKKQGFKHYSEISSNEITHVISHSSRYTIFIFSEAGSLNQMGFNRKTDELRKNLRPFRMDPELWEEHRKKMIAWEKDEKRKRR